MPEGSFLPIALWVLYCASVAAVVILIAVLYNQLVAARQLVGKAFSDIDVLIQKRGDEIPKLVDLCKVWMKHEQGILAQLTELRQKYQAAGNFQKKIGMNNLMMSMLMGIFGKAEAYPALKTNGKMLDLQKKISEIESQIAGRREHFNRAVAAYNTFLQQIPVCYIAGPFRFKSCEMLKTSDLQRLDVDTGFK